MSSLTLVESPTDPREARRTLSCPAAGSAQHGDGAAHQRYVPLVARGRVHPRGLERHGPHCCPPSLASANGRRRPKPRAARQRTGARARLAMRSSSWRRSGHPQRANRRCSWPASPFRRRVGQPAGAGRATWEWLAWVAARAICPGGARNGSGTAGRPLASHGTSSADGGANPRTPGRDGRPNTCWLKAESRPRALRAWSITCRGRRPVMPYPARGRRRRRACRAALSCCVSVLCQG